jgi:hypothetical protein
LDEPAPRFREIAALRDVPGLVHGFGVRRRAGRGEAREESLRRAQDALAPSGRLLLLRQVHGAEVARVPWEDRPEADAAMAGGLRQLIGIRTADCLPVLIADPRRRIVGAAHAGWRGTAKGVVGRLVAALLAEGCRAEDLIAALGPAIGPCCYEVGEEVRLALGEAAAPAFRPGPRGRPHLDLRAANRQQLLEAGLRAVNLHAIEDCTACRPDLYDSHRRDGSAAGRMLSYIGFVD